MEIKHLRRILIRGCLPRLRGKSLNKQRSGRVKYRLDRRRGEFSSWIIKERGVAEAGLTDEGELGATRMLEEYSWCSSVSGSRKTVIQTVRFGFPWTDAGYHSRAIFTTVPGAAGWRCSSNCVPLLFANFLMTRNVTGVTSSSLLESNIKTWSVHKFPCSREFKIEIWSYVLVARHAAWRKKYIFVSNISV